VINFRCNKNTVTHIGELNIFDVESAESYKVTIEALMNEYLPYVLKNQEGFYTHEIIIRFQDAQVPDNVFWKKAVFEFGLLDLAEKYLSGLIQIAKWGKPVWLDEENPAARNVALNLALYSKEYVPRYTEYLEWHDMDHEVYEYQDIDEIMVKYGWCEETLDLAALRAGIACGQKGMEQFEELVTEKKLKEYLCNHGLMDSFIFQLFLQKYLRHYKDEMKRSPGWLWLLEYTLDSLSDLLEVLVEQEEEKAERYEKGKVIAEEYYRANQWMS
jgi:hypothetical protein